MTLPGWSPSPLLFSFPGVPSRLAHSLLLIILEQMCFHCHGYRFKRPAMRDCDILQTCSSLIVTTLQNAMFYYLHFTGEEAEAHNN